jgi:hypothetical protein
MNRWSTDPRLRRFARIEVGLAIAAIALGVFLYNGLGARREAADDRASVERRIAAARDDLAELRSGAAADHLRDELRRLEAEAPPEFPPLADALQFGAAVTEYASSQQLAVDAFDVASSTYESGGVAYPAISYSIDVRGPAAVLVGLLSLPTRVPTAVFENLELTRAGEPGDDWRLQLTLSVVHAGG